MSDEIDPVHAAIVDEARKLVNARNYDTDQIVVYPDAEVDDSPEDGAWVTAQIWVPWNHEEEDDE